MGNMIEISKKIFVGWVIVLMLMVWPMDSQRAVAAPICRMVQAQNVCILSIKRSAKNFWEYNAAISVEGKRGPKELYNCRNRYKVLREGQIEYFEKDSIGSLVCKIYKPTRSKIPTTLSIE